MTTSAAIEAEHAQAALLIQRYLGTLASHGYRYEGATVDQGKNAPDRAVFTFVNDAARRRIRISYSPPYDDHPRNLIAMVKNDQGDKFMLAHFLRAHQRDDLIGAMRAKNTDPDMAVYFDDWFRKFADLLASELLDIIEGRRWEDVPFDWGGFK